MKKVLFIAIVVVFGLGKLSAQGSNFGITAGFPQFYPLRWMLEV